MGRKLLLLMGIVALLGIGSVMAQSDQNQSPLLQMLARIPDAPTAHDYLTYVDYRALIAARHGTPNVTSWQEFNAIQGTKEGALFMSVLQGIMSGPQFYLTWFRSDKDMPATVGFDQFAIDRAVEYNNPPATVTLLQGSFDANAIIVAHEARGYTINQSGDFTLLCGSNGCYRGLNLDPSAINHANPFGGDLGRTQPVLVGDQIVASSPAVQNLTAIVSAAGGKIATIADHPDYRAAAEAISANGKLLQAYFVNPLDLNADFSTNTGTSRIPPAVATALMSTLTADAVLLPPYNLVVLADSATADEEQALVALVYTNESDAQAAAAFFPDRLEKYVSFQTNQTFGDILTGRGVTSMDTSIYAASTNRYVMVLTLHAPLPSNDIPAGGSTPVSSSLVYDVLVRAYQNRDLGWLATQSQ